MVALIIVTDFLVLVHCYELRCDIQIESEISTLLDMYEKSVPSSFLQTCRFMDNKWSWSHQVTNNLAISLTKQLLYLIECLSCKN